MTVGELITALGQLDPTDLAITRTHYGLTLLQTVQLTKVTRASSQSRDNLWLITREEGEDTYNAAILGP